MAITTRIEAIAQRIDAIISPHDQVRAAGLTVSVEVRNVYGTRKAYPVCARAFAFARIANTTTLTHSTLAEIELMGFEIVSMANADWRRVD